MPGTEYSGVLPQVGLALRTRRPVAWLREVRVERLEVILGWSLLLLSLLAGLTVVYWGDFTDETDNLVVGAQLARGAVLYRDVFSHHFPLPYYWSAAIVHLFGYSLFAARLAILLFQVGAFAVAAQLTGYWLPLGLASLAWQSVGYMYKSNMVLYNMFAGAALVVVSTVSLAIMLRDVRPRWYHALAIGLAAAVAILSDPLSIYAVGVALLLLTLARADRRWGLAAGLVAGAGLALYGVYLLASGTTADFVRDALTFNAQIYSQYIHAGPQRLAALLQMSARGLHITAPMWLKLDPWMAMDRAHAYGQFDRWLFTGFLFRGAVILVGLLFVIRRRYRAAALVYFGAAAQLIISEWDFHAACFVMSAFVAAAGFATGQWQRGMLPARPLRGAMVLFRVLVAVMLGWLVFRVGTYTLANRSRLSFGANFGAYVAESKRIVADLACNAPGVALGYYPGNPTYYWFTGMQPVARYFFLWPWVADVGQQEIIDSLAHARAVVFLPDTDVWGIRTQDYLRPLRYYLDKNYVRVDQNWYVSPTVAAECASARR